MFLFCLLYLSVFERIKWCDISNVLKEIDLFRVFIFFIFDILVVVSINY